MGTNYYLHLGKRSSIGTGRCSFTWASPPPVLLALESPQPQVGVIDEYGHEISYGEFLALVAEDEQRHDRIGERFS